MASRELSDMELERYERAYEAAYQEHLQKPMEFFPHDSDAHRDDALRRLVMEHGMAFYGRWWLLVELLTAKKGHAYDVGDETGWRLLSMDMSALCPMGPGECREFVAELAGHGLLDAEMLGEGKVVSARVCRNTSYASEIAARRAAGGAKGGRPRKPQGKP